MLGLLMSMAPRHRLHVVLGQSQQVGEEVERGQNPQYCRNRSACRVSLNVHRNMTPTYNLDMKLSLLFVRVWMQKDEVKSRPAGDLELKPLSRERSKLQGSVNPAKLTPTRKISKDPRIHELLPQNTSQSWRQYQSRISSPLCHQRTHGAHQHRQKRPLMASPTPHTRKATNWVAWQTGPLRARMDEMAEVEDNNTTETTEVQSYPFHPWCYTSAI